MNATQAETFGAVVVQDFDSVAIEDGVDGAGKRSSVNNARNRKSGQHQK